MTESAHNLIDAGFVALQKSDWALARQQFERALQETPSPQAYDGLGIACWWLNDIRSAHQHRMAAYNGYKSAGQLGQAAIVAYWLGREQVFLHANITAMQGWFARAERLVELLPPGTERDWCHVLRASMVASPAELERVSSRAIETGRAFGDSNLEAFALAFCGMAKVSQGYVEAGMHDLDEAMTMTTSGEVTNLMTISEVFCLMLSACETVGDVMRCEQWCQKAWEFAEQHHCPFLSAYCRTTYGSVLTTMGRWQEAENALLQAIHAFESGHRGLRLHAVIRLADLRVYQNRLEEAQVLLHGLQDQESASVPLARLHLAKGEVAIARAIIEQSLRACPPYMLNHLPNLLLLIDILIATDQPDVAQEVVDRLVELTQQTQSGQIAAQIEMVKGRLYRQMGDTVRAEQHFVTALDQIRAFQQSLLAGQIRLSMARTLQTSDRPGAIVWAKAALATFKRLGSAYEANQASQLLRQLGAADGSAPHPDKPLTQRETEITELIAQGLTNREISDRLVISPKTVEHHVSRILSKLDLRSRTEIAAFVAGGKLTQG